MTTKQSEAGARGLARRATLVAVVTPTLAGCVWAALVYVSWKGESAGPEADMSTAVAFWELLVLGCAGFISLLVPMAIGLTARSRRTRVVAASIGAGIAALAGAFWLVTGIGSDTSGSQAILGYASGVVLFVPVVVLGFAVRREPR